MKTSVPLLLPLLRSRAQGEVIAWLVLHADSSFSLTEVAAATETSVPTVKREVDRLVEAGLASETRSGNQRLIRATTYHPVYKPLAELMAVTFGPVAILSDLLVDVAGVDEALVYGSWAARYADRPGAVPGDIDVLVVGSADRHDLETVSEEAERRLRREVNIRRVSPERWTDDSDDSFRATVLSRPVVRLRGLSDD